MSEDEIISVNVRFFAYFREITGIQEKEVAIKKGSRILDLIDLLCSQYKELKDHRNAMLVSINHNYAMDDCVLKNGDEVAIFPPLSGG